MKFDLYQPFIGRDGKYVPGTKPLATEWKEIKELIDRPAYHERVELIRTSDDKETIDDAKKSLLAVTFMGSGKERKASAMTPTQLVMIDIDHVENWKASWEKILNSPAWGDDFPASLLLLAYVTPRKGLRLVFWAREECRTIAENIGRYTELLSLNEFGDVDSACKDLSRLSFLTSADDILYESPELFREESVNNRPQYIKAEEEAGKEQDMFAEDEAANAATTFSEEEKEKFEAAEYRGTLVSTIIAKYVEFYGEPSSGERHNYYNEMVKNFRCITDNNKKLLLYLLPRFGHTLQECASQIASICRVNTLSTLPKPFYFFLKDHGFYQPRTTGTQGLRGVLLDETESTTPPPPYLPPVIREFVRLAPKDFVVPSINALLPILGTLTSYVQSRYPYDDRLHTTSFFSVIYAPPSAGKGFVERFMDKLFVDLRWRDFVQTQRENIYLRTLQRKGANDKAPENPHTSLRIIPAKNSEAEFLSKQQDNGGMHMFTFAAEMDSWAKGSRAAGGNKDDMIRIAWDNGEYGQQFKSVNTFKGMVRLYWNVLICGTIQQVESYFKNVENGLVTRCSFTSIENQEFAMPTKWKTLRAKDEEVIRRFTDRCDANTYESPCTLLPEDLETVSDEKFDEKIDWKFKFRERKTVDCSWIMPTLDAFQREQMEIASLNQDRARDVFRRRVGVRGFRLAMLCTCLWEKPTRRNLKDCCKFIDWWLHRDLENMLKLWGEKYNEIGSTAPQLSQRNLYGSLPKEFSKSDLYAACVKAGVKTPLRRIIFDWKKIKAIEQKGNDKYEKKAQV